MKLNYNLDTLRPMSDRTRAALQVLFEEHGQHASYCIASDGMALVAQDGATVGLGKLRSVDDACDGDQADGTYAIPGTEWAIKVAVGDEPNWLTVLHHGVPHQVATADMRALFVDVPPSAGLLQRIATELRRYPW